MPKMTRRELFGFTAAGAVITTILGPVSSTQKIERKVQHRELTEPEIKKARLIDFTAGATLGATAAMLLDDEDTPRRRFLKISWTTAVSTIGGAILTSNLGLLGAHQHKFVTTGNGTMTPEEIKETRWENAKAGAGVLGGFGLLVGLAQPGPSRDGPPGTD